MTIGLVDKPPHRLCDQLRHIAATWARSQHQLVLLAARFADSSEWALEGAPTAAHWLAQVADVEPCTAREWIRIGRRLRDLPATADAFADRRLSYSKVRALTRIAMPDNEAELVRLAERVPAGALRRALGAWLTENSSPEELDAHHQRQRSVKWRNEADGMVTFTMRLPPLLAGNFNAALTAAVTRRRLAITERGKDASAGGWPTMAQQQADALATLLAEGAGDIKTELIVHLRGDGATLDDGTPVPGSVVERIAPRSFLRVLLHDCERRPINASYRRRHPSDRQKRVVKERDQVCVDCGRDQLLEYDHNPPFCQSRRTIVQELQLRCAPCHQRRHDGDGSPAGAQSDDES